MKHLDNLEKIDHTICLNFNRNEGFKFGIDNLDHADCKDFEEFDECYTDVLNVVDAFEILKEKRVNVDQLRDSTTLEDYNKEMDRRKTLWAKDYYLTKEEYETLRKVL